MDIQVKGRVVALSEMGWLEDPRAWDEDVAQAIAVLERIDLTDEHWTVIREARAYYEETGTCPELRGFCKLMQGKYGAKLGSKQYLYELFPAGLVKSANKIAGLTRPTGCS